MYDYKLYGDKLPQITYAAPPALERAVLGTPLEFLTVINPTGNTLAFKIRIGDDVRLLKVVRLMGTRCRLRGSERRTLVS